MDAFWEAIGLLIETLKRNPPVRRIVVAVSVFGLILASAVALASKLANWPVPFEQLSPILPPVFAASGFMLFLGLAAYTGLRIRGSGGLQVELQSLREERKRITERIAETPKPDILDTIQLSLNQLNEYYTINKSQARSSFTFSVFAVIVGLATLLGGIWIFYLRETPKIELTAITSIAGVLTQFIGAAYFYLYRRSQEQLNFFFAQLVKMQDTMLSVKLCEQVQPLEKQGELREKIILTLLQRSSTALYGVSGGREAG
jgi:hypothetical protein